jgi:hypothetical protein
LNEGLAFACASDRNAPASAARSFDALRNMAVAWWGWCEVMGWEAFLESGPNGELTC